MRPSPCSRSCGRTRTSPFFLARGNAHPWKRERGRMILVRRSVCDGAGPAPSREWLYALAPLRWTPATHPRPRANGRDGAASLLAFFRNARSRPRACSLPWAVGHGPAQRGPLPRTACARSAPSRVRSTAPPASSPPVHPPGSHPPAADLASLARRPTLQDRCRWCVHPAEASPTVAGEGPRRARRRGRREPSPRAGEQRSGSEPGVTATPDDASSEKNHEGTGKSGTYQHRRTAHCSRRTAQCP